MAHERWIYQCAGGGWPVPVLFSNTLSEVKNVNLVVASTSSSSVFLFAFIVFFLTLSSSWLPIGKGKWKIGLKLLLSTGAVVVVDAIIFSLFLYLFVSLHTASVLMHKIGKSERESERDRCIEHRILNARRMWSINFVVWQVFMCLYANIFVLFTPFECRNGS